ncbi:sugar ABC transporter ATP-binding protein [Pseudonocardia sp.]|uniref:sugar ABC transporter ATP-binding protein n=1 Tax=Pseudonocardia sp. TaxID=60912 RepID=UPI003D15182A
MSSTGGSVRTAPASTVATTPPADRVVALRVQDVSKTFGATRALRSVSFEIERGSIHALLGGNGSGKSTMIKIMAGFHRADPGGTITVGERTLAADATSAEAARASGLRFVHQTPAVFGAMTIAENIAMDGGFPTTGPGINWSRLRKRTRALLERFEIPGGPDTELGTLRPAEQTMVAVARALQDVDASSHCVLVLDEPTASLPPHEASLLLSALRSLASSGQAILLVSHRIDEVLAIADAVTVLRDGELVVTRPGAGLTEAQLVEYIVGRPVETVYAEPAAAVTGETVLELRDVTGGPLRGVDLHVRKGEIVGIAGLLGSGRTELLRMIFGADPVEGGVVRLGGADLAARTPAEAMVAGVAYVPEDREHEGMLVDHTVQENISLASLRSYRRRLRISSRRERGDAARAIERFSIRTPGPDALMSSLSGGNQQKVVVARWLKRDPRLLLLDEPTQGVDVAARAEIHRAVRDGVDSGLAVLLVSSDMEELALACDRVLVLRRGRIVGEVGATELTKDRLTELVYLAEETS